MSSTSSTLTNYKVLHLGRKGEREGETEAERKRGDKR